MKIVATGTSKRNLYHASDRQLLRLSLNGNLPYWSIVNLNRLVNLLGLRRGFRWNKLVSQLTIHYLHNWVIFMTLTYVAIVIEIISQQPLFSRRRKTGRTLVFACWSSTQKSFSSSRLSHLSTWPIWFRTSLAPVNVNCIVLKVLADQPEKRAKIGPFSEINRYPLTNTYYRFFIPGTKCAQSGFI